MPSNRGLPAKDCHRVRLGISILVSIGLTCVMLWGLVSIHEPKATLNKLNLRNVNEKYSTIYLEMEVTNRNHFRGFNYSYGWVEFFYLSDNESWQLTYDTIPTEYHGFRKTLHWNFTMNISAKKLEWPLYSPLLKSQEAHIYASFYMTYVYKILFWTTHTKYHQWLDTIVYTTNSFDLKEVSAFHRTKNFTLALST